MSTSRYEDSDHRIVTLTNGFEYTKDAMKGIRAVHSGLSTYYEELLKHAPETFVDKLALPGAIAEEILYGLLDRADAFGTQQRYDLTQFLEGMLPALAAGINGAKPVSLVGEAVVHGLTRGQVDDQPPAVNRDLVLLTLACGSLCFDVDLPYLSDQLPPGGFLVLPADFTAFPGGFQATPAESYGWQCTFKMGGVGEVPGLRATDVSATRPGVGLERLARQLTMPSVLKYKGASEQSMRLDDSLLSHAYSNPNHHVTIEGQGPYGEIIMSAVYRLGLDGSSHPGDNIPHPALVVRQQFAFSEIQEGHFEPSHCLRDAHFYPMSSIAVSDPLPGQADFVPDKFRADHRLELEPNPTAHGQVAGIFKDKDDIALWVPLLCPGGALSCFPLPLWSNMFDSTRTVAPVASELLFGSSDMNINGQDINGVDNVHLHPIHPGSSYCWTCPIPCEDVVPIVEAPASFENTVHMHWRWGEELGSDFGGGVRFLPENQKLIMALTNQYVPNVMSPDFVRFLQGRFAPPGVPEDILTAKKILFVGAEQSSVSRNRKYETLGTGLGFALGPRPGLACDLVNSPLTRAHGYCWITKGFRGAAASFVEDYLRYGTLLGLVSAFCDPIGLTCDGAHATIKSGPSACGMVSMGSAAEGRTTPFIADAGVCNATIESFGGEAWVMSNVFGRSIGVVVAQPPESGGAIVRVTFDQDIAQIRRIPLALRQLSGSGGIGVRAFRDEAMVLDTVVVVMSLIEGEPIQGYPSFLIAQGCDRIEIRSIDTVTPLAIGPFQVCLAEWAEGDLDYNGSVDFADWSPLKYCYRGPGVTLGFDCTDPDLDTDGDVDCSDVALFESKRPGADILLVDCNHNGVPDGCDIAAGAWPDEDGDGRLDGCTVSVDPALDREMLRSFQVASGHIKVHYTLTEATGSAVVEVFDLLGRRLAAIDQGSRGAGTHELTWSGVERRDLNTSILFVRLKTDHTTMKSTVLFRR